MQKNINIWISDGQKMGKRILAIAQLFFDQLG